MAEAVVKPVKIEENVLDSYSTCYICLEQVKSSKCLPCTHMFCRDCLKQYIEKQQRDLPKGSSLSAFPCPVCRQNTLPTIKEDAAMDWADKYPQSYLVSSIEEAKALRESKKTCKFCEEVKGNSGVTADLWCRNCNVFYCNICKVMHNVLHKDHIVLPITEILKNPFSAIRRATLCEEHGEIPKLFCETHKQVGCKLCMTTSHQTCPKISIAKDVAMEIKEKKEIETLVEELDAPIADMSGLTEIVKNHFEIQENDKNTAEDMIGMIMEEVKEHFLEKITTLYKKGKEKNSLKLKRCQQLEFALTHLRSSLLAAIQVGDDADVVMMKTSGKTQLQKYCSEVLNEFKQREIERLALVPEVIKTIKRKIEIAKNTVTYYNQKAPLTYRTSYPLQARMKQSLEMSFPGDEKTCDITGLLFYQEDRIIAVDSANSSIKLVTASGEHLSHLSVPGCELWGVCQMSPHSFTVTCGFSMKILMVEVDTDQLVLKNTVTLNNPVYGIAYTGTSLVITDGASPSMIRGYTTEGKEIHSTKGLNNMRRIAKLPKSGKLVASRGSDVPATKNDQSEEVVFMVYEDLKSQPGKQLLTANYTGYRENYYFRYKLSEDSIRHIRGLAADEMDNVLLVGEDKQNVSRVIMISLNREKRNVLEGISPPSAISLCQDEFVLSESKNNTLKLYSMF